MTTARLRSVLYVPGANQRALEKAAELPSDALIFDLEDSVTPSVKPAARERVRAVVDSRTHGERPIAIRINGAGTEWHHDDVRAVAQTVAAAVLIPKVSAPVDVKNVERALTAAGAPDELELWAMLETPAAALRAAEIASSSERLSVLVVGTNDLRRELGAQSTVGREPLLTSLSLCVLGARVAGRQILDGPFNDVADLAGFETECVQSRRFGFDGKTLIHPGQIEPCNRIFAPSEAELDHARHVIAAFTEAEHAGAGVATVDGVMIERLHVEEALRVLSLGERS